MNTKSLSQSALEVVEQYVHFSIGKAVCSIPYFNNKKTRAKATLRTYIGKGSPQDIHDEISAILVKQHISSENLADESLKKLLVDNNIGIDCSGLAYYILMAESESRQKGSFKKNLKFINAKGIFGKIRCSLRPVENCDVATLSDKANSMTVDIRQIQPGDMITMLGSKNDAEDGTPIGERDHVLIVDNVEYKNNEPAAIHYTHAVAYPEDGLYGTGVRQGKIEIVDSIKKITEQKWIDEENGKDITKILDRARKTNTEIKRLIWFN